VGPEHQVWNNALYYFHSEEAKTLYMKPLLETADSMISFDAIAMSAWLQELLISNSENYESSLAQFHEDPNATTLAISDELSQISEIIVAKHWREGLSDELVKEVGMKLSIRHAGYRPFSP